MGEDMVLDTVSILLDMVMGMVIMLDSATLLLDMVMVMVLDILGTMESVKLRLSQKLMLSMEPTDMVMDLDTVHTLLDIADTLAMDTDMGVDMDTMVELQCKQNQKQNFLDSCISNVELTNIMSCYKNEIIKTK